MSPSFLCRLQDVPEGALRRIDTAAGLQVCVARAGDAVFACQATCPHKGLPLCDAHLEGGVLTCLEHLWQWDLREGGAPRGHAREPLTMYAVAVQGQEVHLCGHGGRDALQGTPALAPEDCAVNR